MRNLEECRAEVFRRSEKRIKKRRQRANRLLMACVPLVLCVAVVLLLLPGASPDRSADPGPAMGALPENKYESYACTIANITVTGHGFAKTYTNTADILRIWDQLDALSRQAPQMSGSTDGGIKENENPNYSSIADTAYRITLTMWEGEPVGYLLTDKEMKDLSADMTYPLTEEQVKQWKALLGILD